jgi:ABC-2 type transport system ATP-binding protein
MTETEPAVTTASVTKMYGATSALSNVSITVDKGTVYGLVGPNGAGKTTLLSLLAGLRTPTSGTIDIAAGSVAVLPDAPTFDRWLTGREVVSLAGTLSGKDIPQTRIDEVLATVDLRAASDRKVGGYSRGMLQRLGLASTVIGEPDLILLDEPAAALDPRGRREVLDLVRELKGHATVIFSSHILDDVEQVCDTIGILTTGSLVYEGSLDRLLSIHGTERTYKVDTDDPGRVVASLVDQDWVETVKISDSTVIVIGRSAEAIRTAIVRHVGALDAGVTAVTPLRRSLEDVFLDVTG